ncbi:uncharacterized protein [Clytia hemisphaerica]|uniref:uncharacterized protein n=1 Tax=Clytia hemisphaerica TaxID=252671 RepID=UPI0034D6BF62
MEVPGELGWRFSGDKSLEIGRSPVNFVQSRIDKYNSKIFSARIMNQPHIFVTSNQGIKEILVDKSSSFEMSYKDFGYMYSLYGEVCIFNNGDEAFRLREIIRTLFHTENCNHYMIKIQRLTQQFLKDLDQSNSIEVYETFKKLTTAICLSVFLDIDDFELLEKYKSVATTHWHGKPNLFKKQCLFWNILSNFDNHLNKAICHICYVRLVSVPLSVKIKGWSSTFGKAMEAKEELLSLIKSQLQNKQDKGRFLEALQQAEFENIEEAASHVLLFVSALIPKALSSLLTSTVIETQGESKEQLRNLAWTDSRILNDILLEASRLYPPFYGGRRIAKENVNIDEYLIPEGHQVIYITRFGNRDEETFDNADQFLPERWQGVDINKRDLVWAFGGGKRVCVGTEFINRILKHVMSFLLSEYKWEIEGEVPPYKMLPVSRPKQTVQVKFTRNSINHDEV